MSLQPLRERVAELLHLATLQDDGTLAHDGRVDLPTLAALDRLLQSGRQLILVSGRELEDLLATFPHSDRFVWMVLENGALLYQTANRLEMALGSPPPERFVQRLRDAGVAPISLGRVILATWQPHEHAVLEAIHDQSLELQVVFNKGAVMVLPSGVNKATGLQAALVEMGLSADEVVGVGDGENDHSFLELCGYSAAVANALPAIKERADLVTRGDHGAGVVELIEQLILNDLAAKPN